MIKIIFEFEGDKVESRECESAIIEVNGGTRLVVCQGGPQCLQISDVLNGTGLLIEPIGWQRINISSK
jgi:hypothetical protein